MMRRGRVHRAAAIAGAMCAVVALPGQARAAEGEPNPYRFASSAQDIEGGVGTADAADIDARATYRTSIGSGEQLHFKVRLDDSSHAYASAVAVPRLGTQLSFQDGIKVSLQDGQGEACGEGDARFGPGGIPKPVAAYADRTVGSDGESCQKAGTYYVVIERTSRDSSSPGAWDVELRLFEEPQLKSGGNRVPSESWPTATPELPAGEARRRAGGTGFNDAKALTQGVWRDEIGPGQTRFYRVPVDWGQRLFAEAELGSSQSGGMVGNALAMALYNPARGFVGHDTARYVGKPVGVQLETLPAVAYENRWARDAGQTAMRFPGWYVLAVSVNPDADTFGPGALPVTLRVKVDGSAEEREYAGSAGVFDVTEQDEEAAAEGQSDGEARRGDVLRLVGVVAIGVGSLLVTGLGLWTVVARRRVARGRRQRRDMAVQGGVVPVTGSAGPTDSAETPTPTPTPTQYGPSQGW
ncbi:hypothetical protein P8605_04630 [Streptomyces sp. T-3]|nr:hypothetical protein [Streptomyces sp. T-3]